MYPMKNTLSKIVLIASLAIPFNGSLWAQESDPLLNVVIVKVIPGKSGEFEDLQRELTEATKKAGGNARHIWQESRGDTNTYHIVSYAENFAQYDESTEPALGEVGMARWIYRIQGTIDKREVVTSQTYPELEIKNDDDYEMKYVVLLKRTVAPGSHAAYGEWLKEKLVPLLRENGVKGCSVFRVAQGGDTNQWTLARFVDSWAELDEPGPLGGMDDEERSEFLKLPHSVNRGSENLMLRYRPSLSFSGSE